jgi:hypothetical protein
MKRDQMNRDMRPWSDTSIGLGQQSTTQDLKVAETREKMAGMISPSGNTRTAAQTEIDERASAIVPAQVRPRFMSAKSLVDAMTERQAQSGRISMCAVDATVCRGDP